MDTASSELTAPAACEPHRFSYPGGVYNATPPRVVFGTGTLRSIGAEVDRLGARRAWIISTPGRAALAERVAGLLGAQCAGLLAEAISQVPIELAERGRAQARALGVDCLITVGGGAATGLGKGIALETAIPLLAVPTTYSGSEMTGFCGITIDGVKRMHTSLRMLPRTVIYDPDLTLDLPPAVSSASAMNALAHCVEALYVPTASPITALAAPAGIAAIARSLPRVVAAPRDVGARSDALYGAYLAGAALTGGFALQHAVAHVLGATFHLPHAVAHAAVLPYVTAYNAAAAPAAAKRIAAALGAQDAAGGLYDFAAAIGAPLGLGGLGLERSDLDRCVELVLETSDESNPRSIEAGSIRALLERAYRGDRPIG